MATLDIDSAIRSRAYEYWKAEGELPGRELDYWLKAEAEIRAVTAPAKKNGTRSASPSAVKSAAKSASPSAAKSPARKPATRAKAKA